MFGWDRNNLRKIRAHSIEREERLRVVTAYDLDAGQKRDYFARRAEGE